MPACVATKLAAPDGGDRLAWRFAYATGSSLPAAWPELASSRWFHAPCAADRSGGDGHPRGHEGISWPAYPFAKKVKLQAKAAVKGGCG